MSYSLQYDLHMQNRYPKVVKSQRKPSMKLILSLICAAAAGYLIFASGAARYLIPGDPNVTSQAFADLVEEIGAGEPVREVFFEFCREIVTNGA